MAHLYAQIFTLDSQAFAFQKYSFLTLDVADVTVDHSLSESVVSFMQRSVVPKGRARMADFVTKRVGIVDAPQGTQGKNAWKISMNALKRYRCVSQICILD